MIPRKGPVFLFLVTLFGACAPAAGPAPGTPSAPPGGSLPFQVVDTSQVARYDRPQPALFVLADPAAFGNWWSATIGQRDPGAAGGSVAFGQEIVIAVLHGQRVTGGYSIEVQEVRQRGDTLVVVVAMHSPPRGALVAQLITSPYQVIKVRVAALPRWRQMRYLLQSADGTVLAESTI